MYPKKQEDGQFLCSDLSVYSDESWAKQRQDKLNALNVGHDSIQRAASIGAVSFEIAFELREYGYRKELYDDYSKYITTGLYQYRPDSYCVCYDFIETPKIGWSPGLGHGLFSKLCILAPLSVQLIEDLPDNVHTFRRNKRFYCIDENYNIPVITSADSEQDAKGKMWIKINKLSAAFD